MLECSNLLTLLASLVQKQLNWNTRDPSLPNKALLFPSPENTHNIQRTEPPVFVSLSSKRTDKYFLLIYQETQEIIITLASNENATLLFFFLKLYYFTQIHPIYVTYSIDIYQHIPTIKISKLWHQLYFITLILERFRKQKSVRSMATMLRHTCTTSPSH